MSEKMRDEQCTSVDATDQAEEADAISKCIGDSGRWQIQMIILLSLFNIPCTWHIYSMAFQASQPDFWCSPPPHFEGLPLDFWRNKTHARAIAHNSKDNPCFIWDVNYDNMTVEDLVISNFHNISDFGSRKCTKWKYLESEPGETVISQWNLVCDRKELADAVEMSFLAGVAIGGLVSGMVSDRLGRKKTLMVSLCLQIIIGVTIAFVPILEAFTILRFLLGFVSVGVVFSGFVLCVELVGGKWRTVAGVGYLVPVPISYMIISGIAYSIRAWRDLQLAITLPSILLIPVWWILPESPRWLIAMGKVEDNLEILKEAAYMNKRIIPPNIDKLLQQGLNESTGDRATILDLFRYPRLRKISLVNFVIWFAVYFMYYGLMMNLSNMGGDIYLNTVISGGVEIPALLLSAVILLKLGRRWPLSVTIFTSGISCLLTLPLGTTKESVTIGLAMLGKFCIACSNAIMPIYTAELYPTVVRNLGVGLSNVSAGMALILVPFIWNLAVIDNRLPFGLLGSIGCIGGLSVLLLEETSNRPLKKSLSD